MFRAGNFYLERKGKQRNKNMICIQDERDSLRTRRYALAAERTRAALRGHDGHGRKTEREKKHRYSNEELPFISNPNKGIFFTSSSAHVQQNVRQENNSFFSPHSIHSFIVVIRSLLSLCTIVLFAGSSVVAVAGPFVCVLPVQPF